MTNPVHDASERLLLAESLRRQSLGLSTTHCNATEMGFPVDHPEHTVWAAGKDNDHHRGIVAFTRGDLATAHELFQACLPASRQNRYVLACVNFSRPWHDMLEEFDGWPSVTAHKLGKSGPTCFIACDGVYYDKFGAALIQSIQSTSDLQVHLHLMDPSAAVLAAALKLKIDGLSTEFPNGERGYYHAARFVRFREFLPHYGELLLLDADQIANRDLTPLFSNDAVAMRFRPGRIEPWNQINASCVYGTSDPASLEYFGKVAAYLTAYSQQLYWGIDQLALYAVWAMGCQPPVHAYTPQELDYDYTDAGVLWPNSGAAKHTGIGARPRFMDLFVTHQMETHTPEGHALLAQHAMDMGEYDEAKKHFTESLYEVMARMKFPPGEPQPIIGRTNISKFVYLPVENAARELQSKMWLAGEMARLGYQVLIGATWTLAANNFTDMPPGLMLFKTANAYDSGALHAAKKAGHVCAVLNEEFFGLKPERWVYDTEIDGYCARNFDLVCAQSERDADVLRSIFAASATVAVTGNPRTMVNRYSSTEDTRAQQAGAEIIVCMMAGIIRNVLPFHEYIEKCLETYGKNTAAAVRLMQEQIEHEVECLPLMLAKIEELSKAHPDKTIRVRAHPSEDLALYQSRNNIIIDDRTPFTERLRDAEVVVFSSGCTTGLEARMAGIPTIRVGEGGHGLSSQDAEADFAEVTIPAALHDFAASRTSGRPLKMDLATIWALRPSTIEPKAFHENKFPAVSIDRLQAMAGKCRIREVDWRTWLVTA